MARAKKRSGWMKGGPKGKGTYVNVLVCVESRKYERLREKSLRDCRSLRQTMLYLVNVYLGEAG